MSLYLLAFLVSIGTLASLLKLGANAVDTEAQIEQANETIETATVENAELTIELGDTPVLAYVPATVTVTEDMPAGYTLKAYSENPTLSAQGTDKTISMVTIPEDGLENAGTLTTALTDNTWGLSTEEPTSQSQDIYFSLPATADKAVTIAEVEDTAAEGSDTVTVYYGVYITPDMPYGTYTGASVDYIVEDNSLATVVYDGNELYFNGDESQTTNTAKYAIEISDNSEKYSHTPNVDDEGNYLKSMAYNTIVNDPITIPGADKVHVVLKYGANGDDYQGNYWSYMTIWEGAHPEYTAASDYGVGLRQCGEATTSDGKITGHKDNPVTVECDITGDSVTFGFWTQPSGGPSLGYGYYAIVTGYDADGNLIYLQGNTLANGDYLIPNSTVSHRFLGWDEDKEATTPTYTSASDIEKELALVPGAGTTLYAIWQLTFQITYNGNGADSTTDMNSIEQYTTDLESTDKQVELLASNFTRDGYGFAGWSTDANAWEHLTDESTTNDPTIYGPNQTITIDEDVIAEAGENRKLILNAVWVPAEENNGAPVTLQNWQGCVNLTATTYDSETGTLNVGKNTVTALTDARDGSVYTVAKLADGNCWTVENLRLDNEATIATSNTNNPVTVDNNVAIKNNDGNTSNHLSPTNNNWCANSDAECLDQSNLNTNNTILTATSPVFSQDFTSSAHSSNFDGNIESYGNYYNWYSATAGQGTRSVSFGNASGDICPTGWRLPYGGSRTGEKGGNTSGGFYYLNQKMGKGTSATDSNNWRSFPNNFVYSGSWDGSSASSRGDNGGYWSSTAGDTDSACNLDLGSGGVYPGNDSSRSNGNSVRCLAPSE